jgi:hypothetical protein
MTVAAFPKHGYRTWAPGECTVTSATSLGDLTAALVRAVG